MLIDKPRCNFKNCRFYFDGNCRSADIYENCKLTDLHSEIAKLTVDLDNAKTEVAREIFEEIERLIELYAVNTPIHMPFNYIDIQFVHWVAELKKKYTEGET